ncbi:MAG: hypothetical protein Q9167_000858 [Letrouitia subvulpina]
MRFRLYATASTALSVALLSQALHKRSNFYSAAVYLTQNNAGLMIVINLALLGIGTVMLGLQRLCFGAFRPSEIEQLYEKAWFAITETCLAMTIFREEVGAWFLVMFVALICGKVWGWIGEGRIETIGQQPPTSPRLFHARLSLSLAISTCFNVLMLRYCIRTVFLQARPNMMVMFAFEFAVLTTISLSTIGRYLILLHELAVIKRQVTSRRAQIRESDPSLSHEEVDSMDIDVPGWEEKGKFIFYLDLMTAAPDFFKLVLYLTFFCVLCVFYGMPIHIIRDVALTIRSFVKRVRDFIKYRQATDDMNSRYPDAPAQEIDGDCIICREELRPWQTDSTPTDRTDQQAPPTVDERLRPKRLPCGHILHLGCLRSWLLRQQMCPTCRRPVLENNVGASTQPANAPEANPVQQVRNAAGPRVYNFGPLRINFFPANQQGVPPTTTHQNLREMQRLLNGSPAPTAAPANIQAQLHNIEQNVMREIGLLREQVDSLNTLRQSMNGNLPGNVQPVQSADTISQPPGHLVQAFGVPAGQSNTPASQLPFNLPPGWNVVPLQRISGSATRTHLPREHELSVDASQPTVPSGGNGEPHGSEGRNHFNHPVVPTDTNHAQGLSGNTRIGGAPIAAMTPTSPPQSEDSGAVESNDAVREHVKDIHSITENESSKLPKWGSTEEGGSSVTSQSKDSKGKGKTATVEDETETTS